MSRVLTERENIQHVLNHTGESEWVPVARDCFYTFIPGAIHDRPVFGSDGEDWFGCHWRFDEPTKGFMIDPKHPPVIPDIREWEKTLKIPDLDACGWEEAVQKDLAQYDSNEKMLRILTESGPFERLTHLTGYEEAFVSMYTEPDAFKELIGVLADFRVRLMEKIALYYKPDLIMTMDDLGSSTGPLLSLDMYRELIKPADSKVLKAIKDQGVYAIYHSCGHMQEFIEDLIEMGADMITPLQGGVNDHVYVQDKYGDRVVFEGCFSSFVCMDNASEEDIRNEVRRVIDTFSAKKNYILSTIMFNERNAEIIFDEGQKYGKSYGASAGSTGSTGSTGASAGSNLREGGL